MSLHIMLLNIQGLHNILEFRQYAIPVNHRHMHFPTHDKHWLKFLTSDVFSTIKTFSHDLVLVFRYIISKSREQYKQHLYSVIDVKNINKILIELGI